MVPQKIGKWLVTEEGIEWTGEIEYFIDKERLLESGSGERNNMYDWLVHMPTKSWLSVEDIYALNTAFVYALNHFCLDFNTKSFVETFIEQEIDLNYNRKTKEL